MRRAWQLDLPVLALAGLLPLAGCALDEEAPSSDPADSDDPDGDPGSNDPDGPEPAVFRTCTALPYTPGEPAGFDHIGNEIVAASEMPTHHARDVVARPDQPATVTATFQYSPLAIDIADEVVRVSLDTCDGWRDLGQARTDDDGAIAIALGEPLPAGVYHLVFEVAADVTLASAYLWSLPAGTHLALFDLDGTLTVSDTELFKDILLGDYLPVSYPDANTLTMAHEGRGHIPVYLTGRPSILDATTRSWLDEQGYAHGIVRLTDRASEALPTDSGVGAYKRDFMTSLADAGLAIDLAYGNSPTDIFAYLSAGLAPDQVWIIGDHAGEEGTHAVEEAWTTRAAEVASGGDVAQPFSR